MSWRRLLRRKPRPTPVTWTPTVHQGWPKEVTVEDVMRAIKRLRP